MTQIIGRGRYGRETYPDAAGSSIGGDHKVLVNIADTTPDFLGAKVVPGANVTVTPVDLGGGDLALSIAAVVPAGSSDHKVLVDGADTTAAFLLAKLAAGIGISLAVLNPAGNEQVEITANGNFGAENIQTTGTANVGGLTATSITDSGLGLGVVHSNAGGLFSSSLIVNADVDAAAAISVSKLAPGAANTVLTTNGGGPTWALLVNANVDPAAAIAGTKINPDFGAQNVVTTGSGTFGAITDTGLGLGIVHSSAGGVFSSSLIVNADVSAVAAIAGTKISPNFGAQNVVTTGTLDSGALTATSITDSSLGLGVVHSSFAGLFSSSLIVNADIDAAAAIAVSKLAPGTADQVLVTNSLGTVAQWASLSSANIGPGAANTILVTNGAATATQFALLVNVNIDPAAAIAVSKFAQGAANQVLVTDGAGTTAQWASLAPANIGPGAANTVLVTNGAGAATQFSLLVNANVDAAAAIAGTKIAPDFGAQDVTTTAAYIQNTASSFIRQGLAPLSGVGAAASIGNFRVAKGSPGWQMYGRDNADAADNLLLSYDSTSSGIWLLGSVNVATTRVRANTEVDITIGGNAGMLMTSASTRFGPRTMAFINNLGNVTIMLEATTSLATGESLTIIGQNSSLATNTAGKVTFKGGASTGTTAATGGDAELLGGDTSAVVGTRIGGSVLVSGGTGPGATKGNVHFQAKAANAQAMAGGIFMGDAAAVPTGDPASGVFVYSDGAKPAWRWPTTIFRMNGTAAGANAGAGGALPATVQGYLDVQIDGTQRKIPYYAA